MNNLINETETQEIAVCLREIYEAVVFDNNNSLLRYKIANAAMEAVEAQMDADKKFLSANSGCSYRLDSFAELVKRFFDNIQGLLDSTVEFISKYTTKICNTADALAITVPYLLQSFGVENKEIGFFVGLGIFLSKIIVKKISESKKRDDKLDKKDILKLIEINEKYLNGISKTKQTKKLLQYKNDLIALKEKIEKE